MECKDVQALELEDEEQEPSTTDQNEQIKHLSSYHVASFHSQLSEPAKKIGELGAEELPLLQVGQIYIKNATGLSILNQRKHTHLPQASNMTLYNTHDTKKVNYLVSGDTRRKEGFAHTSTEAYKGSREFPLDTYKYKYKTDDGSILEFDRGHLIDYADGDKNSNADRENYSPQVSFYNRHIRNHLVKGIRDKKGAFKEISIYDDNPILIDNQTPLPIGFVFMVFKNHIKECTYYFPNLINYRIVKDEDGYTLKGYHAFCDLFEINDSGAFKNSIVEQGNTEEHFEAIRYHSSIGYGVLYGHFQFVPKEHGGIPINAQVALHKMVALHHLDQSGELEYGGIEWKAALVRVFSSRTKYLALDRMDPVKKAARLEQAEKFFDELSKVGMSEDDYSVIGFLNQEKVNPEGQELYKKMVKIEKKYGIDPDDKEGEDIYNLDRAFYWLNRIKECVSTTEEKEILLGLYQIEVLRNPETITNEKNLELSIGKEASPDGEPNNLNSEDERKNKKNLPKEKTTTTTTTTSKNKSENKKRSTVEKAALSDLSDEPDLEELQKRQKSTKNSTKKVSKINKKTVSSDSESESSSKDKSNSEDGSPKRKKKSKLAKAD
ncbi:hypothetical protein DICPUDRAFT_151081 [Dictyostelium purpureum]|uniref:DNA/RNA non-specific endonuclease/pyrophosphatase/phosphodiesterase domain-containing protein n=1 Tax=Dictyostelium purpureum TaxID=5786 RepID=F0ZHY3_DICPU|nr:uncharacterized protein DICPUDRAFT_151081 [Dictyostelium purpureum]EGC36449.1 hypothetical protein DICPUDRAFT_151081 [Dictyostelium purpureum]|eukprot:XP_003287021.1 hypothetical protein DICPUDRAFT_151081 [Dictyostelium purpureum]